jgi:N-acyl-D-amino-acid deacylase
VRRALDRKGIGTTQLKDRPSGFEKRADSNGAWRANGSPKKSCRGASTDGHGSSMAPVGEAAKARPHPRSYGTFPRVLGFYARERGLFDLPTAVHKMTALPADQIGLADRGRVARGKKADLVVFDAAKVRDTATFDDPHRYPEGIVHVLVNGVPVVERGAHTGARPGRALRRN